MSVQEIESQLTKLTPAELTNVARFLETLREAQSPIFARDLGERHREMDAGRKISETELAHLLAAKPAAKRL